MCLEELYAAIAEAVLYMEGYSIRIGPLERTQYGSLTQMPLGTRFCVPIYDFTPHLVCPVVPYEPWPRSWPRSWRPRLNKGANTRAQEPKGGTGDKRDTHSAAAEKQQKCGGLSWTDD